MLAARQALDLLGPAAGRTLLVTGGAGAELVTELPGPSFDAVLDAAVLLESALGAVPDGGSFVGMAPAAPVAAQRGIDVRTLNAVPDGAALAELLALAAEGTLEVRVAGRVPLREAPRAYDEVARGGHRGRWLLIP